MKIQLVGGVCSLNKNYEPLKMQINHAGKYHCQPHQFISLKSPKQHCQFLISASTHNFCSFMCITMERSQKWQSKRYGQLDYKTPILEFQAVCGGLIFVASPSLNGEEALVVLKPSSSLLVTPWEVRTPPWLRSEGHIYLPPLSLSCAWRFWFNYSPHKEMVGGADWLVG